VILLAGVGAATVWVLLGLAEAGITYGFGALLHHFGG